MSFKWLSVTNRDMNSWLQINLTLTNNSYRVAKHCSIYRLALVTTKETNSSNT